MYEGKSRRIEEYVIWESMGSREMGGEGEQELHCIGDNMMRGSMKKLCTNMSMSMSSIPNRSGRCVLGPGSHTVSEVLGPLQCSSAQPHCSHHNQDTGCPDYPGLLTIQHWGSLMRRSFRR